MSRTNVPLKLHRQRRRGQVTATYYATYKDPATGAPYRQAQRWRAQGRLGSLGFSADTSRPGPQPTSVPATRHSERTMM
jgi:hypothetical protein